jgi:capsular polysaccharide export protein
MIDAGIAAFAGRSVLLLQGPMGPFFSRLAQDLLRAGARVHKVNFNAGDAWFYRHPAEDFDGPLDAWPQALEALIERHRVDVVLLFGDCRPLHRLARDVVLQRGLELGVFEEGYVRPDYITLERFGVNGHSRLSRSPGRYRNLERSPPETPQRVGNAYWHGVLWAVLYATAVTLGRRNFPHYEHHRPLGGLEALRWLRGAWRRMSYAAQQRGVLEQLTGPASGRYFLVPLQVHCDAQIHTHSPFCKIGGFIESVMASFAAHAPLDALLVIKHHPMDRAHTQYAGLIATQARQLNISERCLYIHDQHLPTLLGHARGVVLINSTVGLQALHHGCATKVCGDAIFNMEGLTYQGRLSSFWAAAGEMRPDPELLARFHTFLVAMTQINGNFYRRLPGASLASGIAWAPAHPQGDAPAVEGTGTSAKTDDPGRMVEVPKPAHEVQGPLGLALAAMARPSAAEATCQRIAANAGNVDAVALGSPAHALGHHAVEQATCLA